MRVSLRKVREQYYSFPERAVEVSKLLLLSEDLARQWSKFLALAEDPFVLEPASLLEQAAFLAPRVESVRLKTVELGGEGALLATLDSRKELVSYARHWGSILHAERAAAPGESREGAEERGLQLQVRFWKGLEAEHNRLFPEPISVRQKTEAIGRKGENLRRQRNLGQIEERFVQERQREEERREEALERDFFEVSLLEKEVEDIERRKEEIEVG